MNVAVVHAATCHPPYKFPKVTAVPNAMLVKVALDPSSTSWQHQRLVSKASNYEPRASLHPGFSSLEL